MPHFPDDDSCPPPGCIEVGYRFAKVHRFDPQQVSAFARAAGDDNPLHHDAGIAARSRFGRLLASGTHTGALLMGLAASHLSKSSQVVGVSFTLDLLKPVYADEEVILAWIVDKVEAHPGNGSFLDLTGSVTGADGTLRLSSRGRVLAW